MDIAIHEALGLYEVARIDLSSDGASKGLSLGEAPAKHTVDTTSYLQWLQKPGLRYIYLFESYQQPFFLQFDFDAPRSLLVHLLGVFFFF